MSTILDSLKKSSDQRDDNSKASIDNFKFGGGKKSSKSGMLLVFVLITLTAAILYFGYEFLYADSDAETPMQTTSESKQSTPINQDKPIKKRNLQNIKRQANNKKQKPNSDAVKKKLKENQNKPKLTNNRNSKNKSLSKKKTNTKVEKTSTEVGMTSKEKPLKKLRMPNENKQKEKPDEVVEIQKYPYVYQLPFSIRKELPQLKLNIHIYDKDPLNRVAVINGVKFEIGDLIDEQVLLKDILRHGVLFDFNGHEFLVPNM